MPHIISLAAGAGQGSACFSSYSEEQAGRAFPGGAGQCTRRIHPAVRGGYLTKSSKSRVRASSLPYAAGEKTVVSKLGPGTGLSYARSREFPFLFPWREGGSELTDQEYLILQKPCRRQTAS